jgi:adenylate kinase
MGARIMVTGVPGVGKSSICRHVSMPESIIPLEFGRLMLRLGKEKGLIQRYEELEALDLALRSELQAAVVEQVLRESSMGTVLIDGHLVVDSAEGFVPGFPADQLSRIRLDAIMILTAPANDIVKRRIRRRGGDSAEVDTRRDRITLHESLATQAALFYALQGESILDVIENAEGELDKTVDQVIAKMAGIVPL